MQFKPNNKQDKLELHVCSDATKNKRIKIFVILCISIVIVVAIISFLPATGRITPKMAKEMRRDSLTEWHKYVKSYINENNQVPLSLMEVCLAAYRKYQRPFPIEDLLVNDEFHSEYSQELLEDPNRFEKEVPYELFKSSKRWIIRELRPGKIYKKMLMIDQDGQIYEIRELPKENYIKQSNKPPQ